VFATLHHAAPHLEIDALVYADTSPMLREHPNIRRLFSIDRNWKYSGLWTQLTEELALLQQLRARHYDLIIHLTDHPRGAWLRRLLGVRFAVAADNQTEGWRKNSFSHLYPVIPNRHTVESHLDALRRIGIQPRPSDKKVILIAGKSANARIETLLAEHNLTKKNYIVLHPGSRWLFKTWTTTQYIETIQALQAKGERVILTGAPDPKEARMISEINEYLKTPVINFSGWLNLKELAALIASAKLFIGVDSVPMHIAAAMQTPLVALFGPSSELVWSPWQAAQGSIIKSEAHPCRPCGKDGCGSGKVSECIQSISSTQVLKAIKVQLYQEPNPERKD
jgi:heptosyltransferase-3